MDWNSGWTESKGMMTDGAMPNDVVVERAHCDWRVARTSIVASLSWPVDVSGDLDRQHCFHLAKDGKGILRR